MTDTRRRTRTLFQSLSAHDRAVAILRGEAGGEDAAGATLARLTVPARQRAALAALLGLVESTRRYVDDAALLLALRVEAIDILVGWIATCLQNAAAHETLSNYLALVADESDSGPGPGADRAIEDLRAQLRSHLARAPTSSDTAADDSILARLQDTLERKLTDAWAVLLILEQIAADVACEFDETPVLRANARDALATTRTRLEETGRFVRRWQDNYEPPLLPDDEVLEDIRRVVGLSPGPHTLASES